jgi:hypothetical protein
MLGQTLYKEVDSIGSVYLTNLKPCSAIVYYDGNRLHELAIFPNRMRNETPIRAMQDGLPIFVLDNSLGFWYPLEAGEEEILRPGDKYGAGKRGDYVPSVRQWVVPQKSH